MSDTCRNVDIDGTTVRLRGNGQPLTPADVDALRDIVAAVKAMPRDLVREARYAASQERIRERNARLAGS